MFQEGRGPGSKFNDLIYLEDPWYFFGIGAVHVCLSDRSDMEQFTVGDARVSCLISARKKKTQYDHRVYVQGHDHFN